MTQAEKLKDLHERKPHYSCARLAQELGIKPKVASVLASRNSMKFMSRQELEDLVDAYRGLGAKFARD